MPKRIFKLIRFANQLLLKLFQLLRIYSTTDMSLFLGRKRLTFQQYSQSLDCNRNLLALANPPELQRSQNALKSERPGGRVVVPCVLGLLEGSSDMLRSVLKSLLLSR